jgi:hypothetical protein
MDLNAIRSKLNSLQQQNKGNGGSDRSLFWKPSIGKQVVRIVPNKFNKANPFTEVYFHYGIGERVMISPINYGEKDPIVEFAKQLRTTSDKENWRLAKKLDPKMRIFVPVIVRGEEDQGVKLWQFGKNTYLEFLSLADDDDIGDYTDIHQGRDITVDTVGPDVNLQTFLTPEDQAQEGDIIDEGKGDDLPFDNGGSQNNYALKTPPTKTSKVDQFDELFS